MENTLYYGDNLTIMQRMKKHSVDLIYLDPPFNSKRNYNLMYKNMTGLPVPEQVEAFCDTWELDPEKEERARQMPILMREYGVDDYYVDFWKIWVNALRNTQPHLLAYLIYMVERLLHMRSLLRPTGTIYLHCDPTASHYIKVMMDGIFGHDKFLGEIIWQRALAKGDAKRKFSWNHDIILAYRAGNDYTFHPVYEEMDDEYRGRFKKDDDDGKGAYRLAPLDSPSPRPNLTYEYKGYAPPAKGWRVSREAMEELDRKGLLHFPSSMTGRISKKHYLREQLGSKLGDVWTDIAPLQAGGERLGYPTQKPIALLKRLILASTNPGDIVFDPFCGCGTTVYASHETERRWMGCDIAILSIKLVKHTLEERYRLSEGTHFKIEGIPTSIEGAEMLFKSDPFQFQHWFVERIGGFPMQKKTADRGIDGRLYFEIKGGLREMILSVKGGNIRPTDIRDLRGVLEREGSADLAGFLSLKEPTKAMQSEAAEAGCFEYEGVKYDRIQFLTVRQVLEEKRLFHTPTRIGVKGATGQMNLAI